MKNTDILHLNLFTICFSDFSIFDTSTGKLNAMSISPLSNANFIALVSSNAFTITSERFSASG